MQARPSSGLLRKHGSVGDGRNGSGRQSEIISTAFAEYTSELQLFWLCRVLQGNDVTKERTTGVRLGIGRSGREAAAKHRGQAIAQIYRTRGQ
jgi:hypothetical protein